MKKEDVFNYFAHKNFYSTSKEYEFLRKEYATLKEKSCTIKLNKKAMDLYGIARLPGTLSALNYIFSELDKRLPGFKPKTILDCGLGPGTSLYACIMNYMNDFSFTAIEKEQHFIDITKDALNNLAPHWAEKVDLRKQKLPADIGNKIYDLGIVSYMISETSTKSLTSLATWLLERCNVLIVVDAGTPQVFSQVLAFRSAIIDDKNFSIIAPCPHELPCPLMNKDFCHFKTRFLRPNVLRKIKSASTNYEDEKFSYLIAAKNSLLEQKQSYDRIIAQPIKRKGHTILDICNKNGEKERKVISKKNSDYKHKSRLNWGDIN